MTLADLIISQTFFIWKSEVSSAEVKSPDDSEIRSNLTELLLPLPWRASTWDLLPLNVELLATELLATPLPPFR